MNQSNVTKEHATILAIETSCDETAVAVVRNGSVLVSNVVSSQIESHQRFGGVVPEVASRQHVETITQMIEQAITKAELNIVDIDAIAVTQGPGLVGSLLVGIVAAKALCISLDIPLIGVHHIAGHIYANQLDQPLHYPLLAVIVSGGHTELIHCPEEGMFTTIGRTRDDAVGEAYDKVARTLGLAYPGGPLIDRMANEAETMGIAEHPFPRAWLDSGSYDFSFSGLKSAVALLVQQSKQRGIELNHHAVARGFQNSVTDVITTKTLRAAKEFGVKQIVLAGGVAANQGLRKSLEVACADNAIPLAIPPFEFCTDNAAMIGAAAFWKWKQGKMASLEMNVEPMFSLTQWSQQ